MRPNRILFARRVYGTFVNLVIWEILVILVSFQEQILARTIVFCLQHQVTLSILTQWMTMGNKQAVYL